MFSSAILSQTILMAQSYSWKTDLHHRLLVDFNKSEAEVKAYIRQYIPTVSDTQMKVWEKSGALEMRVIDGEKRFFHHAAPNLFRIDKTCKGIKVKKDGHSTDGYEEVDKENVSKIINEAPKDKQHLAEPKKLKVRYTLTVNTDAVPAGETVRCWLPFPRTDITRQQQVKLLATSEKQYQRSPESCAHSSVYMEKKAEAGKPTVFSEEFEYTTCGSWFNLKPEDIRPYNTSTALYKEYISERDRHIVFTPRIRQLADSLTRGETNPLLKARRIFKWINDNFPWASAREYSTIENIPEYVLENPYNNVNNRQKYFKPRRCLWHKVCCTIVREY